MGARLRKLGKNGHYYFIAYDATRRPKEKSYPLHTTRKDLAMRKYADLMDRFERGTWSPWERDETFQQQHITVQEGIELFLKDRSHLRGKTLKTYRQQLEALPLPPGLVLSDILPEHLRSHIHDRSISKATRAKRYRHVRVFIRWAHKTGHLNQNLLDDIPTPRASEKSPRFLTPADVERLLSAIDYATEERGERADVEWLRDMIVVAINTGLRAGELRNLHWSDVDLDSGFVAVRNRDGFETKSGRERRVPLVGDAAAVLVRRKKQRSDKETDEPVFLDRRGHSIDTYRLSHRFKDFVRLARLDERFRFHDTRHTCGSWLAMKGVPLRVIQEILGHATITTTEIYAHLSPQVMRDALQRTFGND